MMYLSRSPPALLPPNVVVVQSPVTTAGDTINVTCFATVTEHLAVNVIPTLEWISPCSMPVTSAAGPNPYSRADRSGQALATFLQFVPLQTSHGGRYTCIARVSIPGVAPIQTAENTDIVVQSMLVIIIKLFWDQFIEAHESNLSADLIRTTLGRGKLITGPSSPILRAS